MCVVVFLYCRRHDAPGKLDNMLAALADRAKKKAGALALVDAEAGPAVVSEVPAKVVGATSKAPKAKAGVKAVPEKSAKKVPAAPVMLGCSKCRGSPKGCVQCRNPNYSGKRFQAK